jgi:hypothetical protein
MDFLKEFIELYGDDKRLLNYYEIHGNDSIPFYKKYVFNSKNKLFKMFIDGLQENNIIYKILKLKKFNKKYYSFIVSLESVF